MSEEFQARLRGLGLVESAAVFSDVVVHEVSGPGSDRVVEGPPWWMGYPHDRHFSFSFDRIAQHQMDDNLLDVVAPSVAALGLDLTHDWNVGPQHDDPYREDTGLRIWINGEPVTFPAPNSVNCMRPLELVNWLMRQAGIGEQFYFGGVQWVPGVRASFFFEEVSVVLLTDEMFEFLSTTSGIERDVTRPVSISSVVGEVDSWALR